MRRWVFVWGPAAGLMLAIFVASSVPDLDAGPAGVSDKTLHLGAYAVLAVLLVRALAGGSWAGVSGGAGLRAWIIATAWGLSDEVHQYFVPGRTASALDWLADAAGAAIGAALVLVWAAGRRGRRQDVRKS